MLYKENYSLNNNRRFLFCQETSQLTSTRLLSFVTGRGESKSCSRENILLWKIILQNILVPLIHTRIIKIQLLNCYCQLSSSVIFRQYGVSQSECKIDWPRPGLPRLSPRPHTEALGTRLTYIYIYIYMYDIHTHLRTHWSTTWSTTLHDCVFICLGAELQMLVMIYH
jgi:hypothetical protein